MDRNRSLREAEFVLQLGQLGEGRTPPRTLSIKELLDRFDPNPVMSADLTELKTSLIQQLVDLRAGGSG